MNKLKRDLKQEVDLTAGDILRDAERAVGTNPRLRAAACNALRWSNPALLARLTGGKRRPSPEFHNV
jgi:hypothetical protein